MKLWEILKSPNKYAGREFKCVSKNVGIIANEILLVDFFNEEGSYCLKYKGAKYERPQLVELNHMACIAEWEPIPQPVDFWTAWQAYESGKTVRSLHSDTGVCWGDYVPGCNHDITQDEIRGKWIIID